MAISINSLQHNMMAMNANRMLGLNNISSAKSVEKLSSGYRINRAADDAAGLAISEKLRRQIHGLEQGANNIKDGIAVCQVADGALNEVDDLLHRMNELSVQAANGILTDIDRKYLQSEVDQITDEINRIGSTTSFNGIHIFDKEEIEKQVGKLTSLITSPSAENGYMSEAVKGTYSWYPSTSMDFSKVDASNVGLLNNASFSIDCPYGCGETFYIKFSSSTDECTGPIGDKKDHNYTIGIKSAQSGSDIVNNLYDYIQKNLPESAVSSAMASEISKDLGGVGISHRSALVKNGNTLIVAARPTTQLTSEAAALQEGYNQRDYGRVDTSGLTSILTPDPVFTIPIQCSGNTEDVEYVKTRLMNAGVLNVDPLDISSQQRAQAAIGKVKYGMSYIASLRSGLGAQQNRLEHTYNNNTNAAENTQAAESQIRDTDMSAEMMRLSLSNILKEAGSSMLAQANQTPQGVLSLLQ